MVNFDQDYHQKTDPLCPVFGECGGCLYQDVPYEQELVIKQKQLEELLKAKISLEGDLIEAVVASPQPYHYRNRLDLKLKRTRHYGVVIGFSPERKKGVIPVEACSIAKDRISKFIPQLKKEAVGRLSSKYRQANLVVRTGDDDRVLWGGIGRRSCQLEEKDYFWTEISGRRIFYSLDTFFQSNLSILPQFFNRLQAFNFWGEGTAFYDLYAGVGLFSIGLCQKIKKGILIEESLPSLKLAQYNVQYHRADNLQIVAGRVEEQFLQILKQKEKLCKVAMIDPPRAGLSSKALSVISEAKELDHLLYLSCNPQTLVRDLVIFEQNNWKIEKVIPFDFFPKTKHLETLVLLQPA